MPVPEAAASAAKNGLVLQCSDHFTEQCSLRTFEQCSFLYCSECSARSRTFKNFYFCALHTTCCHENTLENAIEKCNPVKFDDVSVMFVMFGPKRDTPPNEKSPQNAFFLRFDPSQGSACSTPDPEPSELYIFIKYLQKNKSRTFTNFHFSPCFNTPLHVSSRITRPF